MGWINRERAVQGETTPPNIEGVTVENDVENVKVEDLTLHPENPRIGNIDAIVRSIEANGWWGTLVAQKSTRNVLAGNHRLAAARQIGIPEVPVFWVDVDDDHALRILLADNRTTDLGEYDDSILADLLADFAGDEQMLLDIGYEYGYVEDLLREAEARNGGATDPFAEWTDMPDFDQPDKTSAFSVTVHFANEEDADEFFKLINRNKKGSIWWPAEDGHTGANAKQHYVAVEDNNV